MRLLLINPTTSIIDTRNSRWNKYRIWQPLGLMTIAGLTPSEWDISIVDENIESPDYLQLPKPDLVGITAFTSQANRAYEIAGIFRKKGVPVVMGGIHASMCTDEALNAVDVVVTGEAEQIWPTVLEDFKRNELKRIYKGNFAPMENRPLPRHDLLTGDYFWGSIQTTRGCPLNCNFCSVTAFNGTKYRFRPVDEVIKELKAIPNSHILIVDDNFIGTNKKHVERAKELLRAMIREKVNKKWLTQLTINCSDDEEFLQLAKESGCLAFLIGFEASTKEGLIELNKKFSIRTSEEMTKSIARIHKFGIAIAGTFIIGLDSDTPGIGLRIANEAKRMGIDLLVMMILTPFPGTKTYEKLKKENHLALTNFPADWDYFTMKFPLSRSVNFTSFELMKEMTDAYKSFFLWSSIIYRSFIKTIGTDCSPLLQILGNLSSKQISKLEQIEQQEFNEIYGEIAKRASDTQ